MLLRLNARSSPVRARFALSFVGATAIAVTLVVHSPGAAEASTGRYYVSESGGDGNTGSQSEPWRTIQRAVDLAPAGATIAIDSGTYEPFTADRPGQTIEALPGARVVVGGMAGREDVVAIEASHVTLSGLTVHGCVPNPTPPGSFEDRGSAGIRIADGTDGVTVTESVIRDSHGINAYGLPFGCYGILVHGAENVTISRNDIRHNGFGVFVKGGGRNVRIIQNTIHDNDVEIRNTPFPDDDYGAVGIGFDDVSAAPGPTAEANLLYRNVGPSHDYGSDGGAFEIYQSSNVTMVNNTISMNDDVLETGADPGGICANNRFTRNTATGKVPAGSSAHGAGLILRCAKNMIVDGNVLADMSGGPIAITTGGPFAAGVAGMRITRNEIVGGGGGFGDLVSELAWRLRGVVIDHNVFRSPQTGSSFFHVRAPDPASPRQLMINLLRGSSPG